jgi:hypothetical protein
LLPVWVSALGTIHHYEIWLKTLQLFQRRANEHVFNEMRLPGYFGNETHGQPSILVCAAISINDIKGLATELFRDQVF